MMAAAADALRLTVPLHVAELKKHLASLPACFTREGVLRAVAARCGADVGHRGDQLMFRPHAANRRAARTAGLSLSEGVAAAALLNPATGVEALGAHFCAGPHGGCPNAALRPVSARRRELMAEFHRLLDEFEALLDGAPGELPPAYTERAGGPRHAAAALQVGGEA